MGSLEENDKLAADVAVAPRVSLDDIKAAIKTVIYASGLDVFGSSLAPNPITNEDRERLSILTLCTVILHNGWIVVGKSAPASPANFNAEVGQKFAYDDAVRQLWPLMGFALRDRLHNETV